MRFFASLLLLGVLAAPAAAAEQDGERLFAPCRACHLPLGEKKDFVQRYDEYFAKRPG